ncbi:MAG: type I-C CRISPR-associated protein Cas7/Csd2 [Bacillota bacterium]|nr:type I-C CRISPR-associated protein Cas7/Csd2 [Bacillota bacterium]
MMSIEGKFDFAVVISVKNANPNGDPLNGNRPRENYDGFGEISDVCIKRKIRNRLQDMGQRIFVQSDDRADDGFKSLKDRADGCEELRAEMKNNKNADKEKCGEIACKEWIDVRSFGQVFAFKGVEVSLGIRGPVSIHQAVSVLPVDIVSIQITKSVNSESGKDSKASDTMGMKHFVDFGVYVIYGSINAQLAEKTGFNNDDAELIRKALVSLFENDASSARPDGSMEVYKLFWWKHNCPSGQYSSAKVHRTLKWDTDSAKQDKYDLDGYHFKTFDLPGLVPEIYDGI